MKKSRLARIGFAAIALTSSSVSFGLAENEDTRKEALVEYSKSARAACIKDKPCFMISNKYPNELPPDATSTPWSSIDYKLNPEAYLTAVLKYVVEGNLEVDWEIDKNKVRKWYHAPWMHNQREPIRGLTRERGSRWHELSVSQTRRTNNWAVGFYNVAGGYAFGNAWKDNAHPNSLNAIFPVGTVSAKLLFTDATDAEAPFINGNNLSWEADINNDGKPVRLRLLQVDVAIKDKESKEHSGWIFGTFVFDASQKKSNYWENLVPVGLEWGNSPKLTYTEFSKGLSAYEGWVNPYMKRLFGSRPPDGLMGYLGRMNGPVDSPLSSCMSCHSRALDSNGKNAPAFNPPESSMCIARVQTENNNETYRRISNCVVDENTVKPFYRNLKSNEPFVPGFNSVDYSLQLALGIANWHAWYKSKFPNEYELIFPTKKPDNSLNLKMFGLNAKKSTNIPMMPAQEAFHRGD